MKPPQRVVHGDDDVRTGHGSHTSSATIEAKPQIRHVIGDVTRFMPTALRVKREMKDAKGQIIKPAVTAANNPGKADESQLKAKPAVQVQTKDDAYDTFMREMAGLL
jgi:WW domain-binding protein 11